MNTNNGVSNFSFFSMVPYHMQETITGEQNRQYFYKILIACLSACFILFGLLLSYFKRVETIILKH